MSVGASDPADVALVEMTPARKMVAVVCVMAATFLVVIDQTIAVVVLPHMQAALGATPDTISWVLTSYILAGAIGTPLTGWLTGRFGRTRFFGFAVLGFTISSVVCGVAVSLPMMVVARFVQGFFGAFMVPMSQTFLYDMNPPSKQVKAITLWGTGVNVAPILGPVLGAYLTEAFDWRWVFFINLPIGLFAAVGIFAAMPAFPAIRRSFDHYGFILIAIAVCSLQLALDRGTQLDWLDSPEILIEFGLAVAAFWMLVVHLFHARHPLIPLGLFRYRNFNAAMLIGLILMPVLVAGSALVPPLLQVLMGYSVEQAAIVMIPRALAIMAGILVGGRMMKLQVDPRIQIAIGVLMIIWAMQIQTEFSLTMDDRLVIWAGVLQGAGMGVAMTVVNFLAIAAGPAEMRTEAAALYTLTRNTGTSIAIAVSSALLARNIQINHAELGGALPAQALQLPRVLGAEFLSGPVAAMANAEIDRQSMMIAYIDDFWLMMWACVAALPLALLVKPKRSADADAPMVHMGE